MFDLKSLNRATTHLTVNHQRIAIAESVTAGLIQTAFSQVKNATDFFEGGITAYNLQQKCTHLFIDPTHAIECNCVSQTVAEQMALGVSKSFNTDWGISITGYSSPVPELGISTLHAWISISFAGEVIHSRIIYAPSDKPAKVQEFFRDEVLDILISRWEQLPLLAAGDTRH